MLFDPMGRQTGKRFAFMYPAPPPHLTNMG